MKNPTPTFPELMITLWSLQIKLPPLSSDTIRQEGQFNLQKNPMPSTSWIMCWDPNLLNALHDVTPITSKSINLLLFFLFPSNLRKSLPISPPQSPSTCVSFWLVIYMQWIQLKILKPLVTNASLSRQRWIKLQKSKKNGPKNALNPSTQRSSTCRPMQTQSERR